MSHPQRSGARWPNGPGVGTTAEDDLAPTDEHKIPPAEPSSDGFVELASADLEESQPVAERPTEQNVPTAAGYQPPTPGSIDPLAATQAPNVAIAGSFDAPNDPYSDGIAPATTDEDALDAEPTRIESDVPGVEHFPAGPRLVIIGGNDRGREFALQEGDHSIGRGLDNNVVLADIAVSRKHTLICKEGQRYAVRDLGSGNGTLVNGKRIHTHLLQDGDQIELGNSLLRFVFPQAALAQAATVVGHVDEVAPPGSPAHATMDVRSLPAPPKAKRPLSRQKKLLIFGGGGVALLLILMIGVKVAMKKAPAPAAKPQINASEMAAKHFEEGRKQFTARNWELARKHYLRVYALAPGFEQAKHYAKQALAEKNARDAIKKATSSLSTKDYDTARSELAMVPSTSVYAPKSLKLKQQVDDEQVAKLIASAKSLKQSGDSEGALAKIKQARKISPTNQIVKQLYDDISEVGGDKTTVEKGAPKRQGGRKRHRVKHRGKPREPRGKPIKIGGAGVKRALAHYKRREWGAAVQAFKQSAEKLKGRRRKKVDKLASAAHKVGQSIMRAEKVQTRNAGKALEYYKKALANDRRIGRGVHQRMLKDRLFKVARMHATSLFTSGRYPQAYSALKAAKRYGSLDGSLRNLIKKLEKKAMGLFTKGYTLRKSNPKKARRLWQTVLRMVPASSAAYQKAYNWLNNSAPRHRDEDED